MQWVVAYDIADDRRRTKVLRLLRDFGASSVQESVVEAEWDAVEWERVYYRVKASIHQRQDTVAFYRQCAECVANRVELGLPIARSDDWVTVVGVRTSALGRRGTRSSPTRRKTDPT